MKRKLQIVLALVLALSLTMGIGAAEAAMLDAIPDIQDVRLVDIVLGYTHSLALDENGEVWAWGDNSYGQWGVGFTGNDLAYTYVKVLGLSDIVQISVSWGSSYALKSDGTVWAWGLNNHGQLGDGTYVGTSHPIQVKNLDGVVEIDASKADYYCIALKTDGTVWSWGRGNYGQLGTGSIADTSTPVQAKISDVAQISVGTYHTIALRMDGTVWAWGHGAYGEMGNGSTNSTNPTPQQVSVLFNVEEISTEGHYNMARKSDGTLWLWGENNSGQIGNGTQIHVRAPVQLPLTEINNMRAGGSHAIAQREDGTVLGWGYTGYAQLGTADLPMFQTTPIELEHFSHSVHLFGGYYSTTYAKEDGSIWGCGYNHYGQLKPDLVDIKVYEPILLFGPGTYVGPGSGGPGPVDPVQHTVTVIERYADGSTDVVNTYTVDDGMAFSEVYTSTGAIQGFDVTAADAQVSADFITRTLDIAKVDRDITITLIFDVGNVIPEPGDHTVTVTETWADGSQTDRITTKQVDDGVAFYQIFSIPAGYTGSLTASGATVSYNNTSGAVHIAAVTGNVDITITYTQQSAPASEPDAIPDSQFDSDEESESELESETESDLDPQTDSEPGLDPDSPLE